MSAAETGADARILWRMACGQPRHGDHAARLQAFYAPQAAHYDAFRERLLRGRGELIDKLEIGKGMRVVELGCGTGSSLDRMGPRAQLCASIQLVDLCPALLAIARQRATGHNNVEVIEADATRWQPPAPVDRVFLSYALTMIPDWEAAIANAVGMLKPGGRLGVVDFHIPSSGGAFASGFWRRWFAHDGVHLSAAHLPTLLSHLPDAWTDERRTPLPYLSGLQAPYYLYVGRRAEAAKSVSVAR
ncbi:MAG: methylase involved in ubiquinone/menaquinone biosynthesi [Rhodocyclaceae bacterium]|jgi:S-adenosylmethionine-diacylgycerolhomoserine-N-methlytransferase|nr:MAG: methylase involved in ubiquinone/menaquinone biosynthesi [Rhodocyclaceae bacterium]TND00601.1 MAG: methylase involved in ubiquinone/menaquinone biosynthesi [Rhodocyclaceae bacterium]